MTDQPTIPFKTVCGSCKLDPEIVPDPNGGEQAVCPGCGVRDNVEDAKRVAGEHLLQQMIPNAQKDAARIAKRELGIKLVPKRVPRRTFKWHGVAI